MFKNKTLFFRYYLYFDFLHGFPPPKKRPSAEPEYSITAFFDKWGAGGKMQNGNKTPALQILLFIIHIKNRLNSLILGSPLKSTSKTLSRNGRRKACI